MVNYMIGSNHDRDNVHPILVKNFAHIYFGKIILVENGIGCHILVKNCGDFQAVLI